MSSDGAAGTDRATRLAESLLQSVEDAIRANAWERALGYLEDVRVLDPHHAEIPPLLQLVERHTGDMSAEIGRRFVTVLFADVVNSTGLGERLQLESYAALLRLFEGAARPVIDHYGGHIQNYFGDGLVAYFGYPTAHEDDAQRGVSASLDLLDEVRSVAPQAQKLYDADLQVRIGVHSGEVVLADRGSGAWMERSAAFGPTMNRASRLQSVAPTNSVVISESTLQLLNGAFNVRSLGGHLMKGIDEHVTVYEVLDRRDGAIVRFPAAVSGPFLGRADELDRLRGLWRDVIAGHPRGDVCRCAEVVGDPGMGKSRLVHEFLSEVRNTDASVIELACGSYAGHIPLWPVRSLLASRVGLAPTDEPSERAAKIAQLVTSARRDPRQDVPVLAGLLRVDIGDEYPPLELAPLQRREVTLATVQDVLIGRSDGRPTVVVLEDGHWADHLTLDLLRRLAGSEVPLMTLVATRRPGVLGLDTSEYVTIELEALAGPQAALLASALLPTDTSLDTIDRVASGSDGVPLFIEHMARSMADAGGKTQPVPAGLEELLQARLDAVGSATRTAHLASVLGRDFELPLLEAVRLKLHESGDVEKDLRDLAVAGLVEPSPSNTGFRFRHALVESKAYTSMLDSFRRDVHVAVAETLSERMATGGDADLAFVALHYERGARPIEAITSYIGASQGAIETGAFEAALSLLTTAAGLLGSVAAELRPALELGVRLTRGYVISSSQGYAAAPAVEDYRVALELCEALADQPWIGIEVVKALLAVWTFHAASGDLNSCVDAERLMERQLESVPYPGGAPSLEACRGVRHFYLGDYATAGAELEHAFASFPEDDIDLTAWILPHDPMVAAGAFLMLTRFFAGDEVGAFAVRDAAFARAEGLPFPQGPFSMAFFSSLEVWVHRFRGDQKSAFVSTERLLEIGARYGFFDWHIVGQMNQPATQAMTEPTIELAAQMDAAITTWRNLGAVVLLPSLIVELANIYLGLGDAASAQRCVTDAFQLAEMGQRVALPDAHVVAARLAARSGDRDAALGHLEAAVSCAWEQSAPLYVVRASVAATELLEPDGVGGFANDAARALDRFDVDSTLPDVVRARASY